MTPLIQLLPVVITVTSYWARWRLKSAAFRLFTVTGEFLAQRTSNAENVSIWWRHYDIILINIASVQLIETSIYRQTSNIRGT